MHRIRLMTAAGTAAVFVMAGLVAPATAGAASAPSAAGSSATGLGAEVRPQHRHAAQATAGGDVPGQESQLTARLQGLRAGDPAAGRPPPPPRRDLRAAPRAVPAQCGRADGDVHLGLLQLHVPEPAGHLPVRCCHDRRRESAQRRASVLRRLGTAPDPVEGPRRLAGGCRRAPRGAGVQEALPGEVAGHRRQQGRRDLDLPRLLLPARLRRHVRLERSKHHRYVQSPVRPFPRQCWHRKLPHGAAEGADPCAEAPGALRDQDCLGGRGGGRNLRDWKHGLDETSSSASWRHHSYSGSSAGTARRSLVRRRRWKRSTNGST